MEKPWMDSLMDALQAPPARKPAPEERVSEEPQFNSSIPERRNVSAPLSDGFGGGIGNPWARPARPPLEYEGSTYWNQSRSDRFLAHAPAITVALLFVVALGALCFFYRVQVGRSLVSLGEKISGEPPQVSAMSPSNPSTVPPVPPPPMQSDSPEPASSSSASSANADIATSPPAGSPKDSATSPSGNSNDRSASDSGDDLVRPSAGKLPPRTSTDLDNGENGQAEFQLADTSLHRARTPEAKARAAGLLWAAVTKGSSDAEIELADAYGRGDGVRKNCQQARILLAAARDKHNALAEKEAAELRVYGCR